MSKENESMNDMARRVIREEVIAFGSTQNEEIEEWEEQFDNQFVDKVKNINGGIAYEQLKYGEQTDVDELRSFIRKTLTTYRTALIEKIEGKNFVADAELRDEYGGTGKETAKIMLDTIKEIISKE